LKNSSRLCSGSTAITSVLQVDGHLASLFVDAPAVRLQLEAKGAAVVLVRDGSRRPEFLHPLDHDATYRSLLMAWVNSRWVSPSPYVRAWFRMTVNVGVIRGAQCGDEKT